MIFSFSIVIAVSFLPHQFVYYLVRLCYAGGRSVTQLSIATDRVANELSKLHAILVRKWDQCQSIHVIIAIVQQQTNNGVVFETCYAATIDVDRLHGLRWFFHLSS